MVRTGRSVQCAHQHFAAWVPVPLFSLCQTRGCHYVSFGSLCCWSMASEVEDGHDWEGEPQWDIHPLLDLHVWSTYSSYVDVLVKLPDLCWIWFYINEVRGLQLFRSKLHILSYLTEITYDILSTLEWKLTFVIFMRNINDDRFLD